VLDMPWSTQSPGRITPGTEVMTTAAPGLKAGSAGLGPGIGGQEPIMLGLTVRVCLRLSIGPRDS
jgi:hypothetical protein